MKRGRTIFLLVLVFFLASGALAETVSLPKETEEMVKGVVLSKGILRENIKDVKQVSFEELPEEVTLKNIDETNLALYKIDAGGDKPFYVITASDTKFKKTVQKFASKMFLSFGFAGDLTGPGYLKSSTGVLGDVEKGYVMMRKGSITGMSTNLEVVEGDGEVEIIIYKDKEEVQFRNTFNLGEPGIYTDYDTLSEGILNFYPGDVISVYVNASEGVVLRDINTLLELETEN